MKWLKKGKVETPKTTELQGEMEVNTFKTIGIYFKCMSCGGQGLGVSHD